MNELTTVAYLGPGENTFTFAAAKTMTKDMQNLEFRPQGNIRQVINAVAYGKANLGVVPIRAAGDVPDTIITIGELVIGYSPQPLYITGYLDAQIEFFLAGKPGTSIKDVRTILTKQEAVDHCSHELARILGEDYLVQPTNSTGIGAQIVKDSNDYTYATLCPKSAMGSELENLIDSPIAKTTSFVMIGSQPYTGPAQSQSAVLVAHCQNISGQLLAVAEGIFPHNMLDIYHVPNQPSKFGILPHTFLIRFDGGNGIGEEVVFKMKDKLSRIEQTPSEITQLGSYPTYQ